MSRKNELREQGFFTPAPRAAIQPSGAHKTLQNKAFRAILKVGKARPKPTREHASSPIMNTLPRTLKNPSSEAPSGAMNHRISGSPGAPKSNPVAIELDTYTSESIQVLE